MNSNLLHGSLVCLAACEHEEMVDAIARWNSDTEYWRLLASDSCLQVSVKKIAEWVQKEQEKNGVDIFDFSIRTLEGDRLVGFMDLAGDMFPNGDAFVGIGIGEREFWGKGYGSDAMQVILRFAFQELNLRRVSLDTFEYNPRAIRSYEKAGFVHEGRARKYLCRDGKRWDLIYMGILREEWQSNDIASERFLRSEAI